MLLAFVFSFLLHADEQTLCKKLAGTIVLTAPTEIFCPKEVTIPDGTRIITNGFPFQMMVLGELHFGEPLKKGDRPPRVEGVRIISFSAPGARSHPGGPIFIYGKTAFGTLEIENFGATEKDSSGEIIIEYGARDRSYKQMVRVDPKTQVDMIVDGYRVAMPTVSSRIQEVLPTSEPARPRQRIRKRHLRFY